MLTLVLVSVAVTLPVVIPDPRHGPSPWLMVQGPPAAQRCGWAGFLLPLPAVVDQAWLDGVVDLSACGVPLLAMGHELGSSVRPYLDGLVLDGWGGETPLELRQAKLGLPLVVEAADGAGVVRALAAGASAVLAARPQRGWEEEVQGLLPAAQAAVHGSLPLPTALRSDDLAIVVGLPAPFGGGAVHLGDEWVGEVELVGEERRSLPVTVRRASAVVDVPPLAGGGVLVVRRPTAATPALEAVTVTGRRVPEVAEVLARHQRAAARQNRLLPRWMATQHLLVRVHVGDVGRSFEVEMEGPLFVEAGVGADWEMSHAWLGGVAWRPERLPNLPLLQAERPPVPPLAVRLEPHWNFSLEGVVRRQERDCYLLSFASAAPSGQRQGEACIDLATFGLVELVERASGLDGEVRSTTQSTVNVPVTWGGEVLWLPGRVVADDLVTAFGTGTSVHREVSVTNHLPLPPDFTQARAAAYGRSHRMVRETPRGVVRLVPDGRGGRVPEDGRKPRVRLLLAGATVDPGLDAPLPFGGLQLADFNFRGRGEQLRVFAAGVVNDLAWSRPRGGTELKLGAFLQLLPFTNTLYRGGVEVPGEEMKVQRQRLTAGVARSWGRARFSLDAEVVRWDFGRTSKTAAEFPLPPDTWEGVLRGGVHATLAATSVSGFWEEGGRAHWTSDGARRWRRFRAGVWHEEALGVQGGRLSLGAEVWGGRHLDRFSAPAPSRFGPVRLRGVPSNRANPDRLGVVRAAVALPLTPSLRGEVGVDAAWVREERAGFRAQPLAGVGFSANLKGPWSTLMEISLGYPLAVPGTKGWTAELLLLRPLGGAGGRP